MEVKTVTPMPLGEAIRLQRGFDLPARERRPGDIPIVSSSGITDYHNKAPVLGPGVVTGRYGTIGEVFFVNEDYWPLNTTLFVKDFKGNDPRFIAYILRTIDFHSHSGKSGVPGVNRNDLHQLPVWVPPLPEQQAIASALGDVDALLASLDQLVTKKRDLKQAALQRLLTGQTRLPGFRGEWEETTVARLGSFSKGRGIKKDEVVVDGKPCVRYGEIYTHHHDYVRCFFSYIPDRVAAQSQLLKKGDLLFAGSGETAEEIGKCVAYLGDEAAYAGGDIVLLSPVNHDSKFLGYLMNAEPARVQKARMGQGDAVVHIGARHLGQIVIRIPKKEEQTAISEVLSDMDAEIAALEDRRDKTKLLKEGMMQELLTGKTRLL